MASTDDVLKAYAKVLRAKSKIGAASPSEGLRRGEWTDQVRSYLQAVQSWVAVLDQPNGSR